MSLDTGELGPENLLETIKLDQLDLILQQLDANEVINLLKSEIRRLSAT